MIFIHLLFHLNQHIPSTFICWTPVLTRPPKLLASLVHARLVSFWFVSILSLFFLISVTLYQWSCFRLASTNTHLRLLLLWLCRVYTLVSPCTSPHIAECSISLDVEESSVHSLVYLLLCAVLKVLISHCFLTFLLDICLRRR